MYRRGFYVSVLVCLWIATAARADVEAFTRARHALQLAFTIPGEVVDVPVKPGDHVKKGDVLIKLDDREVKAQVDLAQLRATTDVAIKAAQASLDMALWERDRLEQLKEKDAGSALEYKKAGIQVEIEWARVQQATEQQQEARHELDRYKAQLDRFTMNAPIDGIIEEITVDEGETVEQLKPILMLVATDPLWVDVPVPTPQTLNLKVDDQAWVTSRLPGFDKPMEGKIILIRQIADPASDTRLVRVELPNPLSRAMPAGVQVSVSFKRPSELAKSDDATKPNTERR